MVNQQMLEGQWNEICGRLKQRWGQLTDDDLLAAQGNVNELIGMIQQKTGASREEVENYLSELTEKGAAIKQRATETAQQYSQRAAEAAQHYSEQATAVARHYRQQASARFQESYSQAEAMIHERPAESMAVAFGAGVVAGVLIGLTLRMR